MAYYTFPNDTWKEAGKLTLTHSAPTEIGFFATSSHDNKGISARIKNITIEHAPVELQSLSGPSNTSGALASDNTATLTWDTVAGATSYNIYRNGKLIATVAAGTTSFKDTQQIDPRGSIVYTIQSSSLGVLSNLSSTVEIRRPSVQFNGDPSSLTFKVVGGQRQKGHAGVVAKLPIVIVATDANGNVVEGAPVTFGILNDGSTYSASRTGSFSTTLQVTTNSLGVAEAYFTFPAIVTAP